MTKICKDSNEALILINKRLEACDKKHLVTALLAIYDYQLQSKGYVCSGVLDIDLEIKDYNND